MVRSFFIAVFIFTYSALCHSQTRPDETLINYTAYHKPLRIVLKDLSKISDVNIIYSESRIPADSLINISVTKEKLGDVLHLILKVHSLTYEIVGDQLVLARRPKDNQGNSKTIYGYIRDKISGELLVGANVFVTNGSRGTNSNEYGFYSFKINQKLERIHFSYLGYKSEILEMYIQKDTFINIYLQPDGLLNEIIVLDDLLEEEYENTASQQNLHIDKILSSNHLAGEADLFRYLGGLAGVSTGADGIGGLNVRGGSSDQNLVLLDGVPVYNTGHAMGIFSIFNSSAIKSASFYKGGIPARYSGRLSSVIDVHTKDGNFNKFGGEVSLSTIAAKATLEGPIVKYKSSYIVSFRRTFIDVWIKEITKFQNRERQRQGLANYYFQDFNAKLNFNIGKKTRLLLYTFQSKDDFFNNSSSIDGDILQEKNDQNLNWGNKIYSLRLNSQLDKSLFSRTSAYQTSYNFESYRKNLSTFEDEPGGVETFFDASLYETAVNEIGVKQDFDWLPNNKHTLKFGLGFIKRNFDPRVTNVSQDDFGSPSELIDVNAIKGLNPKASVSGSEWNVYVEDEISLGEGLRINGGLNFATILTQNKKQYTSLQPRLALLAGGENLYFKFGISKMQQYLHLLTNNGLGLPTDIFVPTNDVLPPQRSWIFNTSFGYRTNDGYRFGMEVYYKRLDDISSFKEGGGIDINQNINWENGVPIGTGNAYGLETFFEKVTGKTLFSLNYSYSLSDRTFPNINNGQTFPFGFNRDHNVKFSVTYRLSQFSEFLVNWSYSSGNYYSQPSGISVPISGQPVFVYLEKNNATFPDFHRLDFGFSFYNVYKWGRAKFFLGLYNAYNRNNPFYSELVRTNNNTGKYELRNYSLLPLLPTISYSISF